MDGNADSTSKPLFGQYSAAKDSGDRPRVRLPGVQEAQARLQDQGTPKLSKALLKPFRFNQKSEENVPPRPFRFSLQPSTPIRSLEVQSARRATSRSTLSTTTNVQTHGSPFEPSERFGNEENTLPASTHLDFGGFRQSGLLNTPNSVASSSNRDDNNGGEDSFVEKVARDFANLKQRNATLQTQNERLTDAHEQSLQEIQRLKSQLSSLSVQLSASEQKNEQLRGALRETEVQLANSTANLKAANETTNGLTEKIQSLTLDFQSLRQENAKISVKEAKTNQRLDEARLVVSGLRESFKQQSEDMQELKEAQGRIQERYGRAIREIQDLRSQASECTSAFQGQSSANVWMASAKEGRTIINELKGELETSRRVSDILRDKLHHMASQLLESKERVKELEQERYDSMARLDTNLRETNDRIESALKLDQAQQEILKRLADRERETIDALTEAAKVEEMLVLAKKEIARLSGVCKAKEAELIPLRSAREDHLSKMLAMQDIVNARDREITGLRTELKSLFESKEDLRALLAEAKKSIVEKEQELSQARSLNPEIESRMQELKERFSSFETAILERSALESKVAALQRECGERDIRIKGLQALLDQERKSSEQAKSASDRLTEASAKERSTLAERHRTELQDLRRELLKEKNALMDSHREELKKKEDALQQALNK
ncbi:hypothetical protein CC1G_14767 [Coprinopsis cinerea okayama7|uniref:Uncharacterized protein n=1 Tax=Coprinopsis cinerea (strain Okayama-7 / 130 / ATCC MYA-4618 / FGSC 9003) TaxID=240176 RepID=D6RNN0_COPC7|nr:hypothetical protein CC1G_14767 [Coprinopsis cinerea okayama7\|eukprot:XP_002910789.1 hypothetical protein CC1G_14767 [Coprinopsis cinerea okayama7\